MNVLDAVRGIATAMGGAALAVAGVAAEILPAWQVADRQPMSPEEWDFGLEALINGDFRP